MSLVETIRPSTHATVMTDDVADIQSSPLKPPVVELLFYHDNAEIFHFDISSGIACPTRERLLGSGILQMVKVLTINTAFLKLGSVSHPILPRSKSWRIDRSFVFSVVNSFWRLNLLGQDDAADLLERQLSQHCRHEHDKFPFDRQLFSCGPGDLVSNPRKTRFCQDKTRKQDLEASLDDRPLENSWTSSLSLDSMSTQVSTKTKEDSTQAHSFLDVCDDQYCNSDLDRGFSVNMMPRNVLQQQHTGKSVLESTFVAEVRRYSFDQTAKIKAKLSPFVPSTKLQDLFDLPSLDLSLPLPDFKPLRLTFEESIGEDEWDILVDELDAKNHSIARRLFSKSKGDRGPISSPSIKQREAGAVYWTGEAFYHMAHSVASVLFTESKAAEVPPDLPSPFPKFRSILIDDELDDDLDGAMYGEVVHLCESIWKSVCTLGRHGMSATRQFMADAR